MTDKQKLEQVENSERPKEFGAKLPPVNLDDPMCDVCGEDPKVEGERTCKYCILIKNES